MICKSLDDRAVASGDPAGARRRDPLQLLLQRAQARDLVADVVEMGLKKEDLKVARGGWPILKRNLDRIVSLTMNMLAYSRPHTLELELTHLTPLLDDCAQLMAEPCRIRGVVLLVDADADLPPIPLDAGQIHQALMNLFMPLEDAAAEGRPVTIRWHYAAGDETIAEAGEDFAADFDHARFEMVQEEQA